MTDRELALAYAPILHFDQRETIPLRAVGYAIMRESGASPSFRRELILPDNAECIIEYPYYWDYDIQHMYDLEHIWVTVGRDGRVQAAEASFHGWAFVLWNEALPCAEPLTDHHVHAYCQPGKHAFFPDGQLFRLLRDHIACCTSEAGGGVLVGGPFEGAYEPTEKDNERSDAYIKRYLTFTPSLCFTKEAPENALFLPWNELKANIPLWIRQELDRLSALEKEA